MTSRAIGYRRVSTTEQADSGLGLAAQEATIAATAARLGLPLAQVYTDAGVSGALAIEDRPQLLAAVSALRRGDVLVVAKRDRLGRDVVNVALVERLAQRRGARVVSCAGEGTDDDGPTGVLLRTLLDAFAQHERLVIGQRTRAALAVKRRRGERVSGKLPYGYRLGRDRRTLEPQVAEQQVLGLLRDLRASGLTLEAVAEELNARGFRMRSGQPWTRQRVFALAKGGDARRAAA